MQGKLTPEGNDLIERLNRRVKAYRDAMGDDADKTLDALAATALSQAHAEGEELRFVVAVMGAILAPEVAVPPPFDAFAVNWQLMRDRLMAEGNRLVGTTESEWGTFLQDASCEITSARIGENVKGRALTQATARIKELEEGLRPFAETGVVLDSKPKDESVWAGQRPAPPITFGHLRRARHLIQGDRGS